MGILRPFLWDLFKIGNTLSGGRLDRETGRRMPRDGPQPQRHPLMVPSIGQSGHISPERSLGVVLFLCIDVLCTLVDVLLPVLIVHELLCVQITSVSLNHAHAFTVLTAYLQSMYSIISY